jgi:Icc protein
MLFAHISDFHVFAHAPETSLVRLDVENAVRKVVADIVSLSPKLDAVMFTGDLTDGGSSADYALLQDILAPITVPVFVVPGNHDRRETLRAAFSPWLPFTDQTTLHYESQIGNVRILALDTLVEGHGYGRLSYAQLRWLAARLAVVTEGPTQIIMHHPPFPSGIKALDDMSLVEDGPQLAEMVRAYRGDIRILSGHIHRPYQAIWNGAFCAVAGSPAFQIGLDLKPDADEPGLVNEPYAYFIHQLDTGGQFTIHTRHVAI